MARFSRAHGGFFTERDLAEQRARWGEPVSTTYRGVTIYETPPPTQGLSVLQMLNLIEPVDLARLDRLGPDAVHLLVQAKQIAFHDRDQLHRRSRLLQGAGGAAALEGIRRRAPPLLDPHQRCPGIACPRTAASRATRWRCARWTPTATPPRSFTACTASMGAGVVAGRTGVVLQNRSAYFSLDPAHPNRLEPGKIPLHTLIASLAFKDEQLWQVLGCMGADGQPQIHLQAYTAMIDYGLDVQEAVAGPRWLAGRFALGDPRDLLNMEARFPAATLAELERRGHTVHRWPDWAERAGHAHGITIDPATGARIGGADPRSDGAAIGY